MTRQTLKWLRWLAPGALFYLLTLCLVPAIPDWLSFNVTLNFPLFELPIAALIFAGIYDVAGARLHSNAKFHSRIKTNIEDRLWEIARAPAARPSTWTDRMARDVFYQLVDNDKSLTARSENIYFNGFLWTTSADLRAVSLLVFMLSAGMALAAPSNDAVRTGLLINAAAFGLSFLVSEALTRRHIAMGNEQLEYIETHLKSELSTKLTSLGV